MIKSMESSGLKKGERTQLNQTIMEKDNEIYQLKKLRDNNDKKIEDQKQKIKRLEEEYLMLTNEYNRDKQSWEKKSKETINRQDSDLIEQLHSEAHTAANLRSENEKLRSMIEQLEKDQAKQKDNIKKINLYKKTIQQHEATISDLTGKNLTLNSENQQLSTEVQTHTKTIRKLKSEAKNSERGDQIRQEEYWQLKEENKKYEA